MDSGVETGNESNDSSATQQNSHHSTSFGVGNQKFNSNTSIVIHNGIMEDDSSSNTATLTEIESLDSLEYSQDTSKNSLMKLHSEPATSKSLIDRAKLSSSGLVLELRIPAGYTCNDFITPANEHKFKRAVSRISATRSSKNRLCNNFLYRKDIDERKMRLAATTNNLELVQRLLEKGVSPNNSDEQGRSPLHLAACRGYTEMVSLLLSRGADPNRRDCIGNTPLHLAAVTSKISVVTLLLMAGTDVLSLDSHGYNPLQLALAKLRVLQNCSRQDSDMNQIKEEVRNVIGMLLAYLQKQKDTQEQIEALSTFCSRLSLSNTSEKIQDDVRDLLASVNSLKLTN